DLRRTGLVRHHNPDQPARAVSHLENFQGQARLVGLIGETILNSRYRYRKFVEWANWTGMLFCTSVSVFFLVAILGYVLVHGASYIDWEFLTAMPVPAGETGGGIANALVGSFLVVIIASLMALPIGIGAAIFINEFPSQGFGRTVRFLAEVLTGVPSIVVGLFAYALIVAPSGGFSGLSGSAAY